MTTMTAMVATEWGGPEVLSPADVAMPVRANAEVLVKVMAAGVNPIDAKTRAGRGVAGAVRSFPVILGYDVAGVVVDLGRRRRPRDASEGARERSCRRAAPRGRRPSAI